MLHKFIGIRTHGKTRAAAASGNLKARFLRGSSEFSGKEDVTFYFKNWVKSRKKKGVNLLHSPGKKKRTACDFAKFKYLH